MPEKTIMAYLAGYLDGDGCITYPQYKHRGAALFIKVNSGDLQTVKLFSKTFGGTVHKAKPYPETKRQQYYWHRGGESAQITIRKLFPYPIAKKRIAEWALLPNLGKSYGHGRPMPITEKKLRLKVQKEIHKFNTRITVKGRKNG